MKKLASIITVVLLVAISSAPASNAEAVPATDSKKECMRAETWIDAILAWLRHACLAQDLGRNSHAIDQQYGNPPG